MTDTDSTAQSFSNFIGTDTPDNGAAAAAPAAGNDSVVLDLWESEEELIVPPVVEAEGSLDIKFELETLTLERERLKKENVKLLAELENLKLEEELAALKAEVQTLGGENAQLLNEIQRRRQAIAGNTQT